MSVYLFKLQCDQNGISDYVQIGGGTELGEYSVISDSICGIDSIPGTSMSSSILYEFVI